ncbi:TetR/AcrR family transcriptional regulator [Streptomyces sp. CB01881]|uniref:TetR/AcrR family transcriptional regulator n=1 Tax=Streptomyces sp. CB01881 TaxID=2078691 RepID=UPI000CDC76F8|nr:TetR/AcrR family transcriptional regulator [Streptomyces sp. CB01881]AUY53434.1 TetR/AcrR family transcriptional regulator [Streptomyces sp. CB01881]TYC69586.1 TetR/AcrR family transcriptional regulator [Streptomyces sp. CB01881]
MPEPDPAAKRPRTRLKPADRQALILAAATEVFSEVGYQRGKMSEVARRVGVSEPVVFQNFGSKAAVFAAVLDHAAAQLEASLRDWAGGSPSVGAWLAELLAPEHLAQVHARGTLGVLFADAMTITAEPVVLDAARRGNRLVAAALADLLADGQRDGSIRSDVEPETGAWWLVSLLASQQFRFAVAPEPAQWEGKLGALTLSSLLADGA